VVTAIANFDFVVPMVVMILQLGDDDVWAKIIFFGFLV
jgi:hypothetical protein